MGNLDRGMSGKFVIGSGYGNTKFYSDEKRLREIALKGHLCITGY